MENKGKDFSSTAANVHANTSPVNEMAIVDTFTKLIFGDERGYAPDELRIIAAFRSVEHTVMRDTYQEMGFYLRDLGVREMIELVGEVKACLLEVSSAPRGVDFRSTSDGAWQQARH